MLKRRIKRIKKEIFAHLERLHGFRSRRAKQVMKEFIKRSKRTRCRLAYWEDLRRGLFAPPAPKGVETSEHIERVKNEIRKQLVVLHGAGNPKVAEVMRVFIDRADQTVYKYLYWENIRKALCSQPKQPTPTARPQNTNWQQLPIRSETGEVAHTYLDYLNSKHWKQIKRAAYDRDNGHCLVCQRKVSLRDAIGHHLTYERVGSEDLDDIWTVCRFCHDGRSETHKALHRNIVVPEYARVSSR